MGASVSICNLTFIAVNVALKQLGPLYFANQLMPQDCVTFKPGKVWFTVEARVWKNGNNDYTNAMAALPIVGLVQSLQAAGSVAHAVQMGDQLKKDRKSFEKRNDTEAINFIDEQQKSKVHFNLTTNLMTTFTVLGIGVAVNVVPAMAISIAGIVVNEIDRVHPDLIVRKSSVLMKDGMKINIKGGPPERQVKLTNETQLIEMSPQFEPLRIVIS